MAQNKATREEEENTLVLWNINSCPIPPGYDPRQVGQRIVSALTNNRVLGPFIITAIGRLTHDPSAPDNDVLRDLSSTGIALIHAEEMRTDLLDWIKKHPYSVNIVIICGPKELDYLAPTIYRLGRDGHAIYLAYPQRHSIPAAFWKSFLRSLNREFLWTSLVADDMDTGSVGKKQSTTGLVLQDKCSETGESPWSCSVCKYSGQSFEDFTTHLKSDEHARIASNLVVGAPKHNPKMVKLHHQVKEGEEMEEEKTLVWWYINSCPIPPGYDPRQVGPRIVSALKNYGVSGPVTITATGRLTDNPIAPDNDVLQELSSSGIGLIDAEERERSWLYAWMKRNPAPANIMVICGPEELIPLASTIYYIEERGYTPLLVYPQRQPTAWIWESFLRNIKKEWLWTSLLADDMDTGSADKKQLTTRLVLPDKSIETADSPWYFTTHLKSEEHARIDSDDAAPKHNPEMVDMLKFHHQSSKKKKIGEVEVEEDTEEIEVEEDTEKVKVEDGMFHLRED